jgi:hypothetical protein
VNAGGSPPVQYSIPLTGKLANSWVFVSFPLAVSGNIQDILKDSTLGDSGTTWSVAKWYDATTPMDRWKTYRTGGLNDLVTIDNTKGVWLYITANGGNQMLTLGVMGNFPTANTPITLTAGWNMVGYPSQTTATAATALTGTGADRVGYWQLASPFVAETATLSSVNMVPGNAYWVRVPVTVPWNVAP